MHPPILIYQMGKVGSNTVHKTLLASGIQNPVFHVHFLTKEKIYSNIKELEGKGLPIAKHLLISKQLLEVKEKYGIKDWKIITLVRNVINARISAFFENIIRFSFDHPGLLSQDGKIDLSIAISVLSEAFENFDESKDYFCNWFDRELKSVFNIDVFSTPFNHNNNFTIINAGDIEVLLLKCELLNTTLDKALQVFMNVDSPFRILNTNISKNKTYYEVYNIARKEIAMNEKIVAKIRSSRFMQHFYPELPSF